MGDSTRQDGYINVLNKYGGSQDNASAYEYARDGLTPDMALTEQYETNGLFAKIIDTPAESAVGNGFTLGLKASFAKDYLLGTLDDLDWYEKATMAIKWARLYGGALICMILDDGRGIDEPVNWRNIQGIEEIRVFERTVITPDYESINEYGAHNADRRFGAAFGMPEYYQVNSMFGRFRIHESRCLVFRNGVLPEQTTQSTYRFWGVPEYIRIKRELRETITSHSFAVKLLERSVQPIYGMKGLAEILAAENGEDIVIRRLQTIDMARSLLNSIAIDSEGESYDFKTASLSGVKEIIETTCQMLSAVTNIPQTVLFGRSPNGLNATGESDLENYYNFVSRIQKLMLQGNLNRLLEIIAQIGINTSKLDEKPRLGIEFNPLWSLSEEQRAQVDRRIARTQLIKAQTAKVYGDLGALRPSEIRRGLAKTEEFNAEELIDNQPIPDISGIIPERKSEDISTLSP